MLLPGRSGPVAIVDEAGREIGTVDRHAGRVWVAAGARQTAVVDTLLPLAVAVSPG